MTDKEPGEWAELRRRLLALLPDPDAAPDWSAPAFRWTRRRFLGGEWGSLEAVRRPAWMDPDDLLHIDEQKERLLANSERFARGLPANNALLTGARGTGKSSLVRACLKRYHGAGLRLIEMGRDDLVDLPAVARLTRGRPERFIVFCDDLSFELGEGGYRALKAVLDGSVSSAADNLLIYATSNRRHLMPETWADNDAAQVDERGELRLGDALEEKLSLAERFGLWLSFYPFTEEQYLAAVAHWLGRLGVAAMTPEARRESLRYALARGGRSGRVAAQFARWWRGREELGRSTPAHG